MAEMNYVWLIIIVIIIIVIIIIFFFNNTSGARCTGTYLLELYDAGLILPDGTGVRNPTPFATLNNYATLTLEHGGTASSLDEKQDGNRDATAGTGSFPPFSAQSGTWIAHSDRRITARLVNFTQNRLETHNDGFPDLDAGQQTADDSKSLVEVLYDLTCDDQGNITGTNRVVFHAPHNGVPRDWLAEGQTGNLVLVREIRGRRIDSL